MATIPAPAFGHWLRTGRLPAPPVRVERKFNPWHDPENGQFTSGPAGAGMGRGAATKPTGTGASQGRTPFGGFGGGDSGGGGASFDGGGASGSWDGPAPAKPEPKPAAKPAAKPAPPPALPAAPASAPTSAPASNPPVTSNGYSFGQDSESRTIEVSGALRAQPTRRSRRAQLGAGGTDRLASDDGGHYIAARFNGPRHAFNHFAQDRNFNRGAYRAMEDQWARLLAKGDTVRVWITPRYLGSSKRPYEIKVKWKVGSRIYRRLFQNRKGGN